MKRTELDRGEIERALAAESSFSAAAKALGINRKTLYDRMRALGMARGKSGRPTRKITYRKRARRGAGLGVAAAALVGGILVGRHLMKDKA